VSFWTRRGIEKMKKNLAMTCVAVIVGIVVLLGVGFLVGRAIDPDFLKKSSKVAEAAALAVRNLRLR